MADMQTTHSPSDRWRACVLCRPRFEAAQPAKSSWGIGGSLKQEIGVSGETSATASHLNPKLLNLECPSWKFYPPARRSLKSRLYVSHTLPFPMLLEFMQCQGGEREASECRQCFHSPQMVCSSIRTRPLAFSEMTCMTALSCCQNTKRATTFKSCRSPPACGTAEQESLLAYACLAHLASQVKEIVTEIIHSPGLVDSI